MRIGKAIPSSWLPLLVAGSVVLVGAVIALAGATSARSEAASAQAQSPIDIRSEQVTLVERLPRISVSYPRRVDVTLVNTGSPDEEATIRADIPVGAAYVTLEGVRFDLLQFHWHTPSEHELDGQRAPIETHFVHRAADGRLLVIGVLVDEGGANRTAAPLFATLPEHAGESRVVRNVRIRGLMPDDRASFRHAGSLTTPPFNEGVQWVVLAEPVEFSLPQIDAFRELFEEGNSREVQPLNGRTILSDAEDAFGPGG